MKYSQLQLFGQNLNDYSRYQDQGGFDDRQDIQKIRFKLKSLYFKRRKTMVKTLIEMLQQNNRPSTQAKKLILPEGIQQQREHVFVISQNFSKRKQLLEENGKISDQFILDEEPFLKIKQRILTKYKVKHQYALQMKNRLQQEDNIENEKRLIKDIYKNKLKQFKFVDKNVYGRQDYEQDLTMNRKIDGSDAYGVLNRNNYSIKQYSSKEFYKKDFIQPVSSKTMNESIVIQNKKNPNTFNYMKIDDPSIRFQTQSHEPITATKILNQFGQNQPASSNFQNQNLLRPQKLPTTNSLNQKRLNTSFQESGYKNFLEQQKRQLQQQKKRMNKLTQEANKALSNEQIQNSSVEGDRSVNLGKKIKTQSQMLDLQQGTLTEQQKQINEIQYLFIQLIDLFILSETIKHSLTYRTFEILSKLYQSGSDYYNQKIELEEPINYNTFVIIIKSVLSHQYQLRSQIDVIVNKLFQGKMLLNFQQFLDKFKSVLNQKQVKVLQPIQNKNQVDKTMDKIKRLFVVWIEMDYFTKKIKETLRKKQYLATLIIKECLPFYNSQTFQSTLLGQFFSLNNTSIAQKLKTDIFFRYIIGKELKKRRFIEWYSNDQHYLKSRQRYQRIGARIEHSQNY